MLVAGAPPATRLRARCSAPLIALRLGRALALGALALRPLPRPRQLDRARPRREHLRGAAGRRGPAAGAALCRRLGADDRGDDAADDPAAARARSRGSAPARPDAPLLLGLLIAGYLAVWLAVRPGRPSGSASACIALVPQSPWLTFNGWADRRRASWLLAGLFQFTPLKYRCLDDCRTPLTFVAQHWRGRGQRRESAAARLRITASSASAAAGR